MPTKHRRIAVVVDSHLSEVLDRAAVEYPDRSAAGLLRELAIIGAESLTQSVGRESNVQQLLAIPGVRPSRGDLSEFLARRDDRSVSDDTDPYRGTKALNEQREENLG
ncbi:MAG TPA: hypothetical protein VMF31_08090 [Solirubrobacterales bacterium]|nr:hypothetical protein [Solirubrobacterales bacterium]